MKIRLVAAGSNPYLSCVRRRTPRIFSKEELPMKTWMKPSVREQEVGLEVTSYMPAEIDII